MQTDPEEQEKINKMVGELLKELRRISDRNFWIESARTAVLIVALVIYMWWILR